MNQRANQREPAPIDCTSDLSENEQSVLRFLIDLEDRGSEWPLLKIVAKGIGITISRVEHLLDSLENQGFVCAHLNLTDLTRYSISRTGREYYFEQMKREE